MDKRFDGLTKKRWRMGTPQGQAKSCVGTIESENAGKRGGTCTSVRRLGCREQLGSKNK